MRSAIVQSGYNMMFLNNKLSILLFFIALFFVMMPVYAQNQYIFPDNISAPSQSEQYAIETVEQYSEQPLPSHSRDTGLTDNNYYHKPVQYVSSNKQHSYEIEPPNNQRPGQVQNSHPAYRSEQSEHYKYGVFNSNRFPDTQTQAAAHNSDNDVNYKGQSSVRGYPEQNNAKPFRYLRPSVTDADRQQRAYTGTRAPDQRQQRTYSGSPGPLYASDFDVDGYITNKRTVNKTSYPVPGYRHNTNYYSPSDYRGQNNQQQVRVQYVPVPVYNVPGTLPGTIPGVVTPANMVPGYSHLSPDYSYLNDKRSGGGYDLSGSQYNPLTGLGAFSAYSNPFNHLYKGYSNNSKRDLPFMPPGDSFPSFLEQGEFLP